jgi:hypothetical protein
MLVRVFSTILGLQRPQPIIVIEDILETEKGEILDVLQGLHSLLEVPDHNILQSDSHDDDQIRGPLPRIRIRHASFRDYLLDRNRSGTFYIDKPTLDQLHTSIFSMNANSILKSAHRGFIDCSCELDSNTLNYIRRHLPNHLNALHSCLGLNKVAAELEQKFSTRIEDASCVPFEALYDIIEPLSVCQPSDT